MPGLMRGIQEAIYSTDLNRKIAESIAVFYKTLVDAGMDKHEASVLTISHATSLQSQLRPKRHTFRIPDLPDMPDVPDLPDLPDLPDFAKAWGARHTPDSSEIADETSDPQPPDDA